MMPSTEQSSSLDTILRRRRRRRRRPPRWMRLSASLVLFGIFVWGALKLGAVAIALVWPPNRFAAQAGTSDWVHTLFVGIDPRQLPLHPLDKVSRRLADSFFVIGRSQQLKQAYVLAIPQETRATLGEAGVATLGEGMAIGDLRLVSNTIEELTGLTIQNRVTVDLNGARTLLEAMGPNEVFFAKPFRYRAMEHGLNIDVRDGWHSLDTDGSLAYIFASGREPNERTERIQVLTHEWHQRLRGHWAWSLWRFKGILREAVATDFQPADFDHLIDDLVQIPQEAVAYATLPGTMNRRGEWLFNGARWNALKSRLQGVLATEATETRASIAITYDDPGDEKVMLLANALTARGCQVIRTARESVNQNDLQLIENPRLEHRSAKVVSIVAEALGVAPRVVLDQDVADAYGAQYSLRLGKKVFR